MLSKLIAAGAAVIIAGLLLSMHAEVPLTVRPADRTPFAWRRGQLWNALEKRFVEARQHSCDSLQERIDRGLEALAAICAAIEYNRLEAADPVWGEVQQRLLTVAPDLADKKLRIMVLRPRGDLPTLQDDPQPAHRAAQWVLDRALAGRIGYDFAMDFNDPGKMFCSQVVYSAYRQVGIGLWPGLSCISAGGTARWLAAFGVAHFETLEPSDLEYDPHLVKVAEWRDPLTLFKDHLDNAVTDVMLEGANNGDPLGFNRWLLPVARLAKG